jgi:hypothetical protein
MTDKNSTIGTHSVSGTYAQWTAFGQKADGTYVFFTSEGGSTGDSSRSLTLKDVAAAMMKMGCVNVIRMDGGGSSAMYVSNTGSGSAGYMHSSSRGVADCILIVKSTPGKGNLKTALAAAKNASCDKYSEATLSEIRTAYDNALKVYRNSSSTDANYQAAADKLNGLLAKKDSASSLVKNPICVNQFNVKIGAGDCTIFTSDFNGGKITAASANHIWTQHVVLTWDSKQNAYVVTSNTAGVGTSTKDITLKSNQILIAAHDNGGTSATNKQLLAKVQVGQVLKLCGVDIESKSIGLLSYICFEGEGISNGTQGGTTDKPSDSTDKPTDSTENTGDSSEAPEDSTESTEDTTENVGDSTENTEESTENTTETTETPDDTNVNQDDATDGSEEVDQGDENKDNGNGSNYTTIIIIAVAVAVAAVVAVVVVYVLSNKKKAQ